MPSVPEPPGMKELLEFPCDYPFKVFGSSEETGDFAGAVHRAVNEVLPVSRDALKSRPSAQGRYLCVTVLVRVEAFSQIESIYAALQRVEGLKYLL